MRSPLPAGRQVRAAETAPDRKSNERGDESRRLLIRAATTLFAERGYEGTSIADVAAGAGSAKASVLYHFKDKETLWIGVVEALWAEVDDFYVANRLSTSRSAIERLEHVVGLFVEAALTWPAYVRIPFIEGATPSWRSEWLVDHHFSNHVRFTDSILRALQSEGRLRPGDIAHYQAILSSSVNVLVAQSAIWDRTYQRPLHEAESLRKLTRLILDLIIISI